MSVSRFLQGAYVEGHETFTDTFIMIVPYKRSQFIAYSLGYKCHLNKIYDKRLFLCVIKFMTDTYCDRL